METQNLWPDFAIETIKSPKTILKEQAGYLMEKTKNVLSADVETSTTRDGKIWHHFYIVAPAMDNYRYKVLSVAHDIIYYPLEVVGDKYGYRAADQEGFLNALGEIFNNPDTTRIISSLMSQSLAE